MEAIGELIAAIVELVVTVMMAFFEACIGIVVGLLEIVVTLGWHSAARARDALKRRREAQKEKRLEKKRERATRTEREVKIDRGARVLVLVGMLGLFAFAWMAHLERQRERERKVEAIKERVARAVDGVKDKVLDSAKRRAVELAKKLIKKSGGNDEGEAPPQPERTEPSAP